MKHLFLVVILGLVLASGSLASPQLIHVADHLGLVTAHAAQDPATITVYITRTGKLYHRDGCRYLRQSKIATTLKEAVERGFTEARRMSQTARTIRRTSGRLTGCQPDESYSR